MVIKRATTMVVAGLAMLVSAPVCGQPAQPQTTATAEMDGALLGQARKLHREGVIHLQRGKPKQAYAAFAAAWGIKKHYRVAGPLGAVELALKHYRDAAEHLHFFLEHSPNNSDLQDRAKTQKLFDEAAAHVVQLTLKVAPRDATIKVNGIETQANALGFYQPGSITITATHAGYRDYANTTVMAAGQKLALRVPLEKVVNPAPDKPTPEGPDARLVGGIAVGVGAAIALGVGIGGSVVAAGYASEARALDTSIDNKCLASDAAECLSLMRALTSHDDASDIALGGYVTGGALAAVSAGLLVWWATDDTTDDTSPTVGVVPVVTPQVMSLRIIGEW